ncbi:MAG: aminotransferase class I/II-fold pyridoxal phosphate-dependent enzyme [Clostridia bacterium]|nr:aminotransferase class I/II-fold pyridoxal phosphate-dependent enzyme [Clostridia bacterium]
MKKNKALFDILREIAGKESCSFHMPGHKRNFHLGSHISHLYKSRVADFDYTEIPGLDDLHWPKGSIKKAQALTARCFGARNSFFLINGCSAGIKASIMACCREDSKVLVPRNAHRSIFEGLILSGSHPLYYFPSFHEGSTIPMGPDIESVRELLKGGDLSALIIIHPNYHGVGADLDLIRESHKWGIPVIVDEAHGSHFSFDGRLPLSSLEVGADVVIHGTHKTLGSLTQTGLLHMGTNRIGVGEIQRSLSMQQTTSPSYILMASLDAMRCDLETMGSRLIGKAVDLAIDLRKEIGEIDGFSCIDFTHNYDMTKILITSDHLSGYQLSSILRREYGIYPELEEDGFVLLMITLGDTEKSADALIHALRAISRKGHGAADAGKPRITTEPSVFKELPRMELRPREVLNYPMREIPLSESRGKLSGSMIVPYPPGIPLIYPGEVISSNFIEYIDLLNGTGHHIQGLKEEDQPMITVLEC